MTRNQKQAIIIMSIPLILITIMLVIVLVSGYNERERRIQDGADALRRESELIIGQ